MPPKKNKVSNKTENKKKEKIIEDKTFGLKNKNRSKAVQKYVQQVQTNVKNSGTKDQRKMELEKEKKKQEKEEKKAKEAELKKLGYQEEKKKAAPDTSASAAAAAERGEYLWTADDFEEVEVDETRLEEQLEQEREALAGRTDLTPVNEETFKAWWVAKKEKEKKEREKANKKAIKAFKQTGRGISGRELFEHDASVFVDDANADDEYEREEEEEDAAKEGEGEGEGKKEADAKAEDEELFDGEDLPDEDDE